MAGHSSSGSTSTATKLLTAARSSLTPAARAEGRWRSFIMMVVMMMVELELELGAVGVAVMVS
jgi:hypothetical protein